MRRCSFLSDFSEILKEAVSQNTERDTEREREREWERDRESCCWLMILLSLETWSILRIVKSCELHCVKSVQIRSFFWSAFSCFWTEYGYLLRKCPYSVRIRENTDQRKLRIWTLFTQGYFPKTFHHRCLTDIQWRLGCCYPKVDTLWGSSPN